tara:strand:- start:287 stop:529 length:243 start_codon:yes stop_codon:yes gene_type:complete
MDVYLDSWIDVNTNSKLNNINKSDYVQICNGTERFWVKIVSIKENAIIGLVNNYLQLKRNYKYGDKVLFGKQHIYEIIRK